MSLCIICNLPLEHSPVVNVGKRGLVTLIKSSKARNDGKSNLLKHETKVTLHVKCRRDYTRLNSIKADAKIITSPSNQKSIALRGTADGGFHFKLHCIFCSKRCYNRGIKNKPAIIQTLEIKNTILKYCLKRNDELATLVQRRINSEIDLVAVEARYHPNCYGRFTSSKTKATPGRPENKFTSEAFQELIKYIDDNKNEVCQFSLQDLLNKFGEFLSDQSETWAHKYLKTKLMEHYGSDLVVIESSGKPTVFCFKGVYVNLDNCYNLKHMDSTQQRKQIVSLAADILKEEIRSKFFVLDQYPSDNDIISGGKSDVPELLLNFLNLLVGKKTEDNKKVLSIANAIISAVRPKSYISPLLLGVGIFVHRKYGSKSLINILSNMGFSQNYKEILKFESAASLGNQFAMTNDAFQQFVFDNADHNIKSLDGYGTFHNMGGIICISPESTYLSAKNISRPTKKLVNALSGTFCSIPIMSYKKTRLGLKTVVVQNTPSLNVTETMHDFKLKNCLWLSGYLFEFEKRSSWNGYMAQTVTGEFETSLVIPLPFINLEPSNLTSIHSALLFAANQCVKQKQTLCVVTFDQPLYIKAVEMVLAADEFSPLQNIWVRLGGFHMLMSFLGSIGYIMEGSGLEELWNSIYAKNSIPGMLNGHSYARSLRAHFLTQLALSLILLKTENVSIDEEHIQLLYNDPMGFKHPDITQIFDALANVICVQSSKSRTGKLWCQYWNQVELIKMFVFAERTTHFDLHLQCVEHMIPYFHAAGHLPYAKSSRLYLQQMISLKDHAPSEEVAKFNKYFALRRSREKFWSAVWSDMTIEQTLMRSLKAQGGLTHGRGLSEKTLTKWVLSMPQCVKFCDALEEFSGINTIYSEQHVELRPSRLDRDSRDLDRILEWLKSHNPFETETDELISISTGIIASADVNCDRALEVGKKVSEQIIGECFADLKLKRTDKVKSLAYSGKKVKVYNQMAPVNPNQLFNRIICVCKSEDNLKECFNHELSPFPPSLFANAALRKTNKAVLFAYMDKQSPPTNKIPDNTVFVIDGGHLLHKVVWPFPSTYGSVLSQYVKFVEYHYGANCTIVFDGYETLSTKNQEQLRRHPNTCADISIADSTPLTISQEKFLSNPRNKHNFIRALKTKLQTAQISTIQADGDADTEIVKTTIALHESNACVTLVGEDTDLLVLLIHFVKKWGVFMMRPGRESKPARITDIHKLKNTLHEHIRDNILFIHAITGTDTTSCLYKQGKLKALKITEKEEVAKLASVFKNPSAERSDLIKNGESFLMTMYGQIKCAQSLNDMRFYKYNTLTARQNLRNNFEIAILPPTSNSAMYHFLRVYLQVQEWLGNKLNPKDWGWVVKNNILLPQTTTDPIAPSFILKLIFCNCKNECGKFCTCRKSNVFCSNLCNTCNGNACHNIPNYMDHRSIMESDEED